MFDWLKGLFGRANDMQQMAEDGVKKAREITNLIPGEADDKLVDSVADKVEEVTQKFDDIKGSLPGSSDKSVR